MYEICDLHERRFSDAYDKRQSFIASNNESRLIPSQNNVPSGELDEEIGNELMSVVDVICKAINNFNEQTVRVEASI